MSDEKNDSELPRCPKCGKPVETLCCSHCGSTLPDWQADLYGAAVRQIAQLGGNRADAGHQGDGIEDTHESDGRPRDNGGASTPQWLFDRCNELAIDACGEPITLDVAAADWNHKCERFFTEEDDGRAQDWNAKAVWLNPPYSSTIIEAFVRKAIESARHGTTTFCLLPWWNYQYLDLCEQHGRIHRIGSPVTFRREDGSTLTMNNQYRTTPLVVVVFGPTIEPVFGEVIRKDAAVMGRNDTVRIDSSQPFGISGRAITGSGDRRREGDDYYTPHWAIDALLDVEAFTGLTWEPAEGDGRIVRAFQKVGCDIFGSDLSTGTDFLLTSKKVENVVTNPPWGLKSEFIQHAKEFARSKVAMLFPLSALAVNGLRPHFEDRQFPLRTVYVFDRRVNFHPDGEGSSTITAGWFVWERGYKGEPVLKWCNRSDSCSSVVQPTATSSPIHIDWSTEEYQEHECY